jgi:hypothetical protein
MLPRMSTLAGALEVHSVTAPRLEATSLVGNIIPNIRAEDVWGSPIISPHLRGNETRRSRREEKKRKEKSVRSFSTAKPTGE